MVTLESRGRPPGQQAATGGLWFIWLGQFGGLRRIGAASVAILNVGFVWVSR